MDTAGRAVIFAGVTVVVSLLGLLLIGIGWVSGIGIGVAVTVLVTMITSITLLPALLGFARERVEVTRWRGLIIAAFVAVALLGIGLGIPAVTAAGAGLAALTLLVSFAVRPLRRSVPRRTPKPVRDTLAYRWSRTIQRRPWAGSSPARHSCSSWPRRSSTCASASPTRATIAEDTSTRQAYDLLAEGFGAGFNGPFMITVVPGAGDGVAAVDTLQRRSPRRPASLPSRRPSPTGRRARGVPHQPRPDDGAPGRSHRRTRRDPARRRHPGCHRRHRRSTSRSPERPPPTSTSPTSSPAAPSSSSAPCWRCRSCC